MFVSELRLFQFRNLEDATVSLPNGPIALVGKNGNGKTNVVEAVSFLSQGRSFRTSHVDELLTEGKKEGSVFGKVKRHSSDLEFEDSIELGVVLSGKKRSGFVSGNKVSSFSDYAGKLVCVTFDPSDLELIQGGPNVRRSFIDRHLVDIKPSLLRPMMHYQKALASKNALLRSDYVKRDQLSPWNQILAEAGSVITVERKAIVRSLGTISNQKHSEYAPSDGSIELVWESTMAEGVSSSSTELFEALERGADREIQARTSRIGPHRDELLIRLGGKVARAFASQGQTRSLVLSLKFGVIELIETAIGDTTVVLLDDVDSELDPQRSKRLFSMLFQRERQLIVTGTREPASDYPYSSVFEVSGGRISGRQ